MKNKKLDNNVLLFSKLKCIQLFLFKNVVFLKTRFNQVRTQAYCIWFISLLSTFSSITYPPLFIIMPFIS